MIDHHLGTFSINFFLGDGVIDKITLTLGKNAVFFYPSSKESTFPLTSTSSASTPFPSKDKDLFLNSAKNQSLIKLISQWIKAYEKKEVLLPKLPLQIKGPPFTTKALKALLKIPFGKVISYKELAKKAGNENASRAIGNICHNNKFPLVIPCHRVIKSDGTIGGFALPLTIKKELLAHENKNSY